MKTKVKRLSAGLPAKIRLAAELIDSCLIKRYWCGESPAKGKGRNELSNVGSFIISNLIFIN